MKKVALLALTLVICLPLTLVAGEISGSIRYGGNPLSAGFKIHIAIDDKHYFTYTDQHGEFRLYVPEEGRAQLTLEGQGFVTAPFEIYSYARPIRYSLEMYAGNNNWLLRKFSN